VARRGQQECKPYADCDDNPRGPGRNSTTHPVTPSRVLRLISAALHQYHSKLTEVSLKLQWLHS
jgi:hypothetical protein